MRARLECQTCKEFKKGVKNSRCIACTNKLRKETQRENRAAAVARRRQRNQTEHAQTNQPEDIIEEDEPEDVREEEVTGPMRVRTMNFAHLQVADRPGEEFNAMFALAERTRSAEERISRLEAVFYLFYLIFVCKMIFG